MWARSCGSATCGPGGVSPHPTAPGRKQHLAREGSNADTLDRVPRRACTRPALRDTAVGSACALGCKRRIPLPGRLAAVAAEYRLDRVSTASVLAACGY